MTSPDSSLRKSTRKNNIFPLQTLGNLFYQKNLVCSIVYDKTSNTYLLHFIMYSRKKDSQIWASSNARQAKFNSTVSLIFTGHIFFLTSELRKRPKTYFRGTKRDWIYSQLVKGTCSMLSGVTHYNIHWFLRFLVVHI